MTVLAGNSILCLCCLRNTLVVVYDLDGYHLFSHGTYRDKARFIRRRKLEMGDIPEHCGRVYPVEDNQIRSHQCEVHTFADNHD
jgi:hypothetical protein